MDPLNMLYMAAPHQSGSGVYLILHTAEGSHIHTVDASLTYNPRHAWMLRRLQEDDHSGKLLALLGRSVSIVFPYRCRCELNEAVWCHFIEHLALCTDAAFPKTPVPVARTSVCHDLKAL